MAKIEHFFYGTSRFTLRLASFSSLMMTIAIIGTERFIVQGLLLFVVDGVVLGVFTFKLMLL